ELQSKVRRLALMGVADVIVDPGFGFAKTLDQNYELMSQLATVGKALGRPMLVGVSRKSMINKLIGTTPAEALNGTTVLHTVSILQGASILRVHDVDPACEAVKITEKIINPCDA
ncbi:MAG: dihydropteroate synthase, partial [Muribaculaceae bacterium]|nr:dihydropteroate synthase [Muribaculaceae bacterium]